MTLALPADWLDKLALRVDQPPRVARVPLFAGESRVGSIEPQLFREHAMPSLVREHAGGWQLQGEVTATLDAIALELQRAGLVHSWRDEQLAVSDDEGRVLGTVERAAVRTLGITTFAVHLAGHSPDGRHWVQQRSLTKANDPGMWDTLMGGMVPARDSLAVALERETWEEAGLHLTQLEHVQYGGRVLTKRPTHDNPAGYIVEWIDWYRCVVPDRVVPVNQDGEVARFALLSDADVTAMLLRDEFTFEAALVLSQSAS